MRVYIVCCLLRVKLLCVVSCNSFLCKILQCSFYLFILGPPGFDGRDGDKGQKGDDGEIGLDGRPGFPGEKGRLGMN